MPDSEFLLYRSVDGVVRVQCRLDGDTVWLNQRQFAELNQLGVGTVNYHIKAIFAEGELSPAATLRRDRIVQDLGSRQITREVDHYSLPLRTIPTTAAHALHTAFTAPRLWRAKPKRRNPLRPDGHRRLCETFSLAAPYHRGRFPAQRLPSTFASLRLCAIKTPPRPATNPPLRDQRPRIPTPQLFSPPPLALLRRISHAPDVRLPAPGGLAPRPLSTT